MQIIAKDWPGPSGVHLSTKGLQSEAGWSCREAVFVDPTLYPTNSKK